MRDWFLFYCPLMLIAAWACFLVLGLKAGSVAVAIVWRSALTNVAEDIREWEHE